MKYYGMGSCERFQSADDWRKLRIYHGFSSQNCSNKLNTFSKHAFPEAKEEDGRQIDASQKPPPYVISGFAPWGFGHYMTIEIGAILRMPAIPSRIFYGQGSDLCATACGFALVRGALCFMCQHRCLRICFGVFGFLLATSSYSSKGPSGGRFFRRWASPGHAAFASMPGRSLTLVHASQLRGVPRPLSFVLPKQQREGSKTSPDVLREYVFPERRADLREFHPKSR